MAKKKRSQTTKGKAKEPRKEVPRRNEPWLGQRTGLVAMGILSLALAGFMTWQLIPSEGVLRAILWGLGFAAAIWGVFFLSYLFNTRVRGRR
jgi:hypothetical protein